MLPRLTRHSRMLKREGRQLILITARYSPPETPSSRLPKSEAVLTPSCLILTLLAITLKRQCTVLIQLTMEHQLCWIKWADSSRKWSPLINQLSKLQCWLSRHFRMVSLCCMLVLVKGLNRTISCIANWKLFMFVVILYWTWQYSINIIF